MKKLLIPLLMLVCGRVAAQTATCTGGLGDPIVDITFGSGTGFGSPLGPGITNMQYIADACPNDGYYTIVHSTTGCFGGTWLNVLSDHTGNLNGYFMLINASYQPSDFYVQTISGLCAGTTYQFAAWILNMAAVTGQILPNITFTIQNTNGTVLQTYNTGDIPALTTVTWVQYGFYFNTPPGVDTVVLRMTNNATGGIGNDLALDDITFRAAGPTIQPGVLGYASDTITLCQNDIRTLGFDATVENCYPTVVYQWQRSLDSGATWADIPGANSPTYNRPSSAPGYYEYRLTVAQAGNIGLAFCKVASAPIIVNVIANPSPAVTIAASTDSSCAGMPVSFTAMPDSGGPAPTYQWMVDGANVGSGGPTYTSSTLSSSDVVSCTMTSDAACVLNPVVVSNSLSITVTAIPATGVSIGSSANGICQDSMVVFTARPSNGGAAPVYQWTVDGVGAGGDSAVFSDAQLNNGDVISCLMQSSLTCATPDTAQSIAMVVYPLPVIELTPDTVIAGGQSLQLEPLVGGTISSYQWNPATWLDGPGLPDPIATPQGTITYRLTVKTTNGCIASAAEEVGVYYPLLMPGAFTPNGDGRNDVFRVPPTDPVVVDRLAVYDRLGVCVYSAAGAGVGWDGRFNGRAQPAGVYVWELVYENPLTRKTESQKGTVVLVR
ncbi:MAG TPA: gliding motility-associated C-terminal domain-containing protein [Puia sp.]|nr:gliding motility-associated C-terminal domain-containing protein [Puia sp.]